MEEAAAKLARRRAIVGDRIREARELKNLLQKELAVRVHVEPQTVSNWERGVTAPDLDKLDLLARELDTTVAFFLVEPEEQATRDGEVQALREELAEVRGEMAELVRLLRESVEPVAPAARKARRRSA